MPLAASRLTVVIPTLNESATIEACLDSVGDDPEVAVVVSDGGSSDDTVARAGSRAGVRVVTGARGRGPQLNLGAAAASSSLLLFLHADCRLPEGWQGLLEEALSDPAVALACFRLHTEPCDPGTGKCHRRWLRLLDLRSRLPLLPYGDQGFGVRHELFRTVDGFPEIPLMEDVAFARACRRRGAVVRLDAAVRTTARRFEQRPVRTRLMTATFPLLFRLGVSPATLARWYGAVR